MVIVFKERGLLNQKEQEEMLKDLDEVCRMITGFIKNLKAK
jgi:hypothetical protein